MQSLWNDAEAAACANALDLRVYTSRLLGRESSLVLHGGGNTSLKSTVKDMFGDEVETLYVKGSGWDLATIEAAGFAPVRMSVLLRLSRLDELSDSDMVRAQRMAMLDPSAPNPSVEAILHAMIPFTFVDHTHTDAVVTISNTPDGEARIRELFGERVLVIPYVMPGFILAKTVRDLTQDIDWKDYDGMMLMHHGLFTFADDAKASYERMIELVSKAEAYLEEYAGFSLPDACSAPDLTALAALRREVSLLRGAPMLACLNDSAEAAGFAAHPAAQAVKRGTMTPDHVIRNKPAPLFVDDEGAGSVTESVVESVAGFADGYRAYFDRHADDSLTCLDVAPRWAVWPGVGCISFGRSAGEAGIISDIAAHTRPAVLQAEAMGGWTPVTEAELFEVEYWELEQAKLSKGGKGGALRVHQGKVALVTGAASGIGKACAEVLRSYGATVVALDINPDIESLFAGDDALGLAVDVSDVGAVKAAIETTVRRFGGLDIVVSNAGIFPASMRISDMDSAIWEKSLALNLTSHQQLFTLCQPYLAQGMDPAVVIIASKNVPAPGPGAAAYSVAKAGLTQLGRVAALEMAGQGIRVNMLHPDAVFDTAIWTEEVLNARAAHYGLSVQEYKTKNLLRVEITSQHIGELASAMAGPLFACTTGAQLPVDGGNERVI